MHTDVSSLLEPKTSSSGTQGAIARAYSSDSEDELLRVSRLDLYGQHRMLAGATLTQGKLFLADVVIVHARHLLQWAPSHSRPNMCAPGSDRDLAQIASSASRNLNSLWSHCDEERSTFSNLRVFVDACEHLLPRIADVRSFDIPAIHHLYGLVESSAVFDAAHDLRSAARQYGYGGEGEPRLLSAVLTNRLVDDEALMAANTVWALSVLPVEHLPEVLGFSFAMCAAAAALAARQAHAPIYRAAKAAASRAIASYRLTHLRDTPDAAERLRLGALIFDRCTQWLVEASRETDAKVRERAQAIFDGKARYAMLHHRDQSLGGRPLIDWFSDEDFRSGAVLQALRASPWIDAGDPDHSRFFTSLLAPGGRMYGVFNDKEIGALKSYFRLPALEKDGHGLDSHAVDKLPHSTAAYAGFVSERQQGVTRLARVEESRYTDLRMSYHVLINCETHPFAVKVALESIRKNIAKFHALRTAIETAEIYRGFSYEPQVFADRISAIYFQQAKENEAADLSFDPESLRLLHLYFAPFALVDGCWLKNAAANRHPSEVQGILSRIFADEIGNSRHDHNHANLYRRLLEDLNWTIAPVDSEAFAADERIPSAAYKAPAFLLAMNLLQADFLPELLGVNLAIEMSGLDGFYAAMIRELEQRGQAADFWRLHISVDNFSTGHSHQSLVAIQKHLECVEQEHGHAVMQMVWGRVWNGFMTMQYLFGLEFRVLFGARKHAAH